MKITVIGAGNMGSAFVKQLSAAGHQVTVTARDSAKAEPGRCGEPRRKGRCRRLVAAAMSTLSCSPPPTAKLWPH